MKRMAIVMVNIASAMPESMRPTPAKRMPCSQSACCWTLSKAPGSPGLGLGRKPGADAELGEENGESEQHQHGEEAGRDGQRREDDRRAQRALHGATENTQPAQDRRKDHRDRGEEEAHSKELIARQPGLDAGEGELVGGVRGAQVEGLPHVG